MAVIFLLFCFSFLQCSCLEEFIFAADPIKSGDDLQKCISYQISKYIHKPQNFNSRGIERFYKLMHYRWNWSCNQSVIILDIGANMGQNLDYFSSEFGPNSGCNKTFLHLFEPYSHVVPKLLRELKMTNWSSSSHYLHRIALSNVSATTKFATPILRKLRPYAVQLSHITANNHEQNFVVKELVTVALDSVFDEFGNSLPNIPLMKIDTEGFDGRVLQGAIKTLKKVDTVIFECSDLIVRSGMKLKEIVDFLWEQGFNVFKVGKGIHLRIDSKFWNDIFEPKLWSDCLAVKRGSPTLRSIRVLC